ncbi:RTA1 like protein-domain-containing protein [Aspergillus pseudoustus]|uniref:RTA1 like protein-domain-containing protein n=1 Tax=Aspergillus pseudoustus TaxID=1810923 RepID=A0ABR4L1V1_9EURO
MASDPKAVDFKLYRYDPSISAAVVFVLLFMAASGIHTYQAIRTRTWFLIPFVIGGHFEWIGYIGRAISGTEAPDFSVNPYIMQTLLLLIAPTLYAATIYMELGRIVLLTDGEAYCFIPRKWLTKIFLLGDIISFIMQGAGGGIMASGSLSAVTTGEHIIIAGLVIQLLFFSLFVTTSVKFHLGLQRSLSCKASLPWKRHMYALYSGSALIFVRSLFRLIEYAQGNGGYLVSHEVYLYLFDALLMVAVMAVFAWVHPSEIHALLTGPGGGARAAERVFWLKMERV